MLNGWNEDKKVIIFLPKTDEDLTDFPVLINLTESSSLTNYDATNIFKELTPISTKDPYWNNVVLYMPMNGENNGTVFPEYKGKLVTVNGDTKTVTTQSKFGGSSAYFDGTNDYLSVPSSVDFDFGTGNCTIEVWMYLTSLPGSGQYPSILVRASDCTSYPGLQWALNINPLGAGIGLNISNGSSWTNCGPNTSTQLSINTWYHVAVVRVGTAASDIKLYINGNLYASSTANPSFETNTSSKQLNISGGPNGACINGYVTDLRITKGVARYTSNFTPPLFSFVSHYTNVDPYWSNVVLNMPLTTEIVDQKGKTVTKYGDTAISSAQRLFNNNTCYFDGSGDYFKCSHTDFAFGTQDFTIECWIYLINGGHGGSWSRVLETKLYGTTGGLIITTINTDSPTKLRLQDSISPTSSLLIDTLSSLANNIWHHIAVTRTDNTFHFWLNGVLQGSQTITYNCTSGDLSVGSNNSGGESFYGYLSNLRITKGTARYTANFTPTPCARYAQQNVTDLYWNNTVLYLPGQFYSNTTAIIEYTGKALTISGDTKLTKNTCAFFESAIYFDGTGDYITIPASVDFAFGTNDFTIEFWAYTSQTTPNYPGIYHYDRTGGTLTGTFTIFNAVSSTPHFSLDYYYGSGWSSCSVAVTVTNTWYHVAFVRSGNTLSLFLNGILKSSTSSNLSGLSLGISSRNLVIGYNQADNAYYNGYLQNLKIIKGIAKYTSNFVPEVSEYIGNIGSPVGRQVWTNNYEVVYHLSQDPSTVVKESTNNVRNLSTYGSMTLAQSPAGPTGKALSFDGVNDYLKSADSNFSTLQTAFTIEAVGKFTSATAWTTLCSIGGFTVGTIVVERYNTTDYLDVGVGSDNIQTELEAPLNIYKTYGGIFSEGVMRGVANGVISATTNSVVIENLSSKPIAIPNPTGTGNTNVVRSIRVSKIAHSATWLNVAYNSDFDTLLFIGGFVPTFSGIFPSGNIKLYGTTQYLQMSVALPELYGTYNVSFYKDQLLLNTYSGIDNGALITCPINTYSGTSYLWYAVVSTDTLPGFTYSSENYDFYVRYLCSGICTEMSTPVSGVVINLHRRLDGSLVGTTTTAGTGVFSIDSTYNEEHYVVALPSDINKNALIYDKIIP